MSWSQALSEVKPELIRWAVNYFGLAIVLGFLSYVLWAEYQEQIDARIQSVSNELESYKDRIEYLEEDVSHRRQVELEEQRQRAQLFSAIEKHLEVISKK
jgi:F0F1-type ATP synthase membrane subunit b/b'